MNKKYIVTLTTAERDPLLTLISTGHASARRLTHARILLKADSTPGQPGWSDQDISAALEASPVTVARVRQLLVEEGLEAALRRRPARHSRPRKLDGDQEAHLIALACSAPPVGRKRWTPRLLAAKMVELAYVDVVSHETVRQVLNDNELKPWRQKRWCIPPDADADFVYHLEDVLDVYKRPADPRRPLVCLDETSKQLVSETRRPWPAAPGQPARYDYEYERQGVCNLFMFGAPLQGWRHVKVTDRRTKHDWAYCMQDLVEVHFPGAERIPVVQDQLNTHNPAALYEVFEPAAAKRILDRLEFHYTPKHGSWLNIAEIELSVLTQQCLDQRIPDRVTLEQETLAWETARNAAGATVDWQFTTPDARIKLKHLYPKIESKQNDSS